MPGELHIVPLGGVGEIGLNCLAVEYDGRIMVNSNFGLSACRGWLQPSKKCDFCLAGVWTAYQPVSPLRRPYRADPQFKSPTKNE
ncbi:MAG: hypothetical protein LBS31_01475 [Candidatus Adiutrix sp.]|jgi:hypothetical protein|nr:hypothetical protein [Candidatus Adiutrix sp.]